MEKQTILKDYLKSLDFAIETDLNPTRVWRKQILREALTKQIPRKVDESVTDFESNALCPACEQSLWDNATYCEECGQKLDWEE